VFTVRLPGAVLGDPEDEDPGGGSEFQRPSTQPADASSA
jgi:hypothetical protein